MDLGLTPQHQDNRLRFREFAEKEINSYANEFDRTQRLPSELIHKLADRRFFGASLPAECGGAGLDTISYGLLHEEIGKACSSARSLLTVHDMVAQAILRWGTEQQRFHWLPGLTDGSIIAAFGLSEPNVGSDAEHVETTATCSGDRYVVNGIKKWITAGQIANLFLVLANCDGKSTAFLVEKESPGLTVQPIEGLLGVRASMLATVTLQDCHIPKENIVGRPGFGFSHVATSALQEGRYSVAWGSVGIGQACLEACLQYTSKRQQFGSLLKEHQLIRRMISDMMSNVKAARLLCIQAAYSKEQSAPSSFVDTMIAKYFAARVAAKTASDAVQIHGANGCSDDYPVARYFRDAKIMEIIEGSNEIQQLKIAEYGYYNF